jgi:hypothetical protein
MAVRCSNNIMDPEGIRELVRDFGEGVKAAAEGLLSQ